MAPIDIKNLHDKTKVLARFAKRDTECGSHPEWGEPRVVSLFVSRATKDYKRGKNFIRRKGSIIELQIKDFAWAAYEEDDFNQKHNEFLVENYRMQILSIERQDNEQ